MAPWRGLWRHRRSRDHCRGRSIGGAVVARREVIVCAHTLGMEVAAVVVVSLLLGDAWIVLSVHAPAYADTHWLGTKNNASAAPVAVVVLGGILCVAHVRLSLGSLRG